MSSNHSAIAVRGLSKSYTIQRNQTKHTTLADALVDRIKHPFQRTEKEVFWALRHVSFEVAPGEIVGIIGRNGAGKSTLLKILSRITRPTSGEVELRGRVGSLLEVGTGFHQELTGRENIYLSGTILGMKRREIKEQFEAIIDFAGVEAFLDTPVKRYSSGMYVRLAFAVSAHLNPEILIVDEVLAVGDAEFQAKCLGKMKAVAVSGRSVLFVSHQMHAISVLCNRGILLDKGVIQFDGDVGGSIIEYTKLFRAVRSDPVADSVARAGSGEYRFTKVEAVEDIIKAGVPIHFRYSIHKVSGSLGRFYLSALLYDDHSFEIAHCDSRFVGRWFEDADGIQGEFVLNSPWLKPGLYRLDAFICTSSGLIDVFPAACQFEVGTVLPYRQAVSNSNIGGTVLADFDWLEDVPQTGS